MMGVTQRSSLTFLSVFLCSSTFSPLLGMQDKQEDTVQVLTSDGKTVAVASKYIQQMEILQYYLDMPGEQDEQFSIPLTGSRITKKCLDCVVNCLQATADRNKKGVSEHFLRSFEGMCEAYKFLGIASPPLKLLPPLMSTIIG